MESIYNFIFTAVSMIIDLTTWVVALAAIYMAGKAIYVMISARSLQLANLLFVPILLGVLALALQTLPELYLRSTRIGLEKARPESALLRQELRQWVPSDWNSSDDAPVIVTLAPTAPSIESLPPTADPEVGGGAPVEIPPPVATIGPPAATQTPAIVVITATPVPTSTPQPTIDPALWNPATPPPTPPIGGG